MTSRYRADLIELAWAIEEIPGVAPGTIGSATNGAEGTFGLITGGVTLPDPTYEWEPFYGVGVVDRNYLIPVQGREVLEGSIPTIYLTHDNSRLVLEQIMGLIFNSTESFTESGDGTITTTGVTLTGSTATFIADSVKAAWGTGASALEVLTELNAPAFPPFSPGVDQANAHDDSGASNLLITFDTTNDFLYVGASEPFSLVRVFLGATVNLLPATISVQFSDGNGGFMDGRIISDGTASPSTDSFGQDGIIAMDPAAGWSRQTYNSSNLFWARFSFSAILTGSINITDIDVSTAHPTHIIIPGDVVGAAEDRWKDAFAFIGPPPGTTEGATSDSDGETVMRVYADYGFRKAGWHGKAPPTSGAIEYTIYAINRASGTGVLPNATGTIDIRESLVQPTFTLASRFTAEDGNRVTVNYMGNKISRATFAFEENSPTTLSIDFLTQDMKHNTGTNLTVLKFADVTTPTFRQISEQPYFFSRATLQFAGTTFARFRRLSLVIDNQLDPRFYVTGANTIDNRQILFEILEGRRQISLSGTVDLDDTSADFQMLRFLVNQGFQDADVRDMATLSGITLSIQLERVADASAGTFDRMTFTLPSGTRSVTNSGLVFRTARHPIPAPPAVHHEIDLDILASSLQIEIVDNVT